MFYLWKCFSRKKKYWGFTTTDDYPEGRGVTSFSFLVKEEMLRAKERVKKKSLSLSFRMRYEIPDYPCWAQPQDSPWAEARRFMPMSSWLCPVGFCF